MLFFKIEYSCFCNGKNYSFYFQSFQFDGYVFLFFGVISQMVVLVDIDFFWVQFVCVLVSLNEFMDVFGEWVYFVDKVYDVFGNVMVYNDGVEEYERKSKVFGVQFMYIFDVKECFCVCLNGCDLRSFFKVVKGKSVYFFIEYCMCGCFDIGYKIIWEFLLIDIFINSGDYGDVVIQGEFIVKNVIEQLRVMELGLYILKIVFSGFCVGQVDELFFCFFLNFFEFYMFF